MPSNCFCKCAHCNSGSHGRCVWECHSELAVCLDCDRHVCICGALAEEDCDLPEIPELTMVDESLVRLDAVNEIVARMKRIGGAA